MPSEGKPDRIIVLTEDQLAQALLGYVEANALLPSDLEIRRVVLERADNGIVMRVWEADQPEDPQPPPKTSRKAGPPAGGATGLP